jgi:Stf0 sulphotransferase
MSPNRSYLVCATPRSGSTLVCQALKATGVAGRPEEYFEALRHSGRPRRPEEYFIGMDDRSVFDHLGERTVGEDPQPRSPLWSRAAYDRYLEWAMETGTTADGFAFESRMKRQTDGINDDWTRRFGELRLGTQFDLVPTVSSVPAVEARVA